MKLANLKRNFDAIRYLEDQGITIWKEGDNVSDGWIGIKCVFCDDHFNHLGINLNKKNYSCYICNETGDAIDLVKAIEDASFSVAKRRLEQYQEGIVLKQRKRRRNRHFKSLLPENFQPIERGKETPLVKQYMKRRGFDLSICQQYKLGYVASGRYKLRLIAPVFLDHEVVSFQAADMTGKASVPYLDCPEDRAIIPNKHLLYGIDDIGDQIILVEGITDKWRVGRDAVAIFTKNMTAEQYQLLVQKGKGKVLKILLDSDASKKLFEIGRKVFTVFRDVFVIQLQEGDPAEMSNRDILKVLNA